jgi:hypothetical protein
MKLLTAAATAISLLAATPAMAGSSFLLDFEKIWGFGEPVDNTYASSGVSFTNVLGLSNGDGLGPLPNGDYYANAPTPLGTAFAQLDGNINTTAFMNVAGGVDNHLSLYYSTPSSVLGAITAWSGLNGTGTLLGTLDLAATDPAYSVWTPVTFSFNGTALSFDLTGTANLVAIDNVAAVPEPESYALLLAGLGLLGFVARRKKQQTA